MAATFIYSLQIRQVEFLTKSKRKRNKKGEPATEKVRTIQRTLFIHCVSGWESVAPILSASYKVFQVVRGIYAADGERDGETRTYSVHHMRPVAQNCFHNPSGKVASWYKPDTEWTRDASSKTQGLSALSEKDFKLWLRHFFGAKAEGVFLDYTTALPSEDGDLDEAA